jgi:subtilisin family serine protease
MGASRKRPIPCITAFAIFLGLSVSSTWTYAQQHIEVLLAELRANSKLHAPDDVLADFGGGRPETAVIVLLQPTPAAEALASESRFFAQVPDEFTGPGAATYYNLQDESVRSQLQFTVTETVNRVIGRLGANGMTVKRRFSYQFGFAANVTLAALERIVSSPEVVAVEKDYILTAHTQQGIALMNATAVRSTYTGAGVSIAICDTGIDTSHPKLGGGGFPNAKVIGGYDTGDGDADPRSDGNAHGTACAGIAAGNIGAVGDYIGGVAPDAKLYAIKITAGSGDTAEDSAIVAGWEWCITHKNDDPSNPILIISTSFGGGRYGSTCDLANSALTTAAANAVAAGITIFASSGNDGYCDSMGLPACISYVNSVGAVYDAWIGSVGFCLSSASCATKQRSGSCPSKYMSGDISTAPDKVTPYSNTASFLTLLAPSHNAYTTDITGSGGYSSGDYATDFGGTSAACPYAAGAAAVLQQAARSKAGWYLTPAKVRTCLVNSGLNIMDTKVAILKPRIDLGKAVDWVSSLRAPELSYEPAVTPGTENTIYWFPAPSMSDLRFAFGSRLGGQPSSKSPGSTVVNSPNQRRDGSGPVQAILPVGSLLVPKVTPDSTALSPVAILGEDFESGFPGSTWALYGSPTWDDVTYDKYGGSLSAWCGGNSLNPANGYANNMNAWMVYGPFSLADAGTASVNFWYKNLSEPGFDYFMWLASVDGVNFSGYQISGDQSSWRSQVFNLADVPTLGNLMGRPQVWIAFAFKSDSLGTEPGAYVDDIVLTKDTSTVDLIPYQPANWNNRIPIGISQLASDASHSYTEPYPDGQTLFFNWRTLNQGNSTAPGHTVHLEVTGTGGGMWNWSCPPVDPGSGATLTMDQAVGPLSGGSHTFKLWVDYFNDVAETNDVNNYYERTIYIPPPPAFYYAECADNPDFTSPTNSGWITQTWTTFYNLAPGATYWYRVKVRSGTAESGWSNIEHSQQEASATGPVLSVTPDNQAVPEGAGTTSFNVSNTGIGTMNWSATVLLGHDWLSISSGSSGTNGGTIQCSYTQNPTASQRIATVRVTAMGAAGSPRDVTVTQARQSFTIDGYLGVGTDTPQRAVHLVGPNAVFRMDRSADTAAFLLVRTDTSGNPLKTFVVGANAAGPNNGEFIINDIGAAVGGGGQRRMTITNAGDTIFGGSLTGTNFFPSSSLALKTNIRTLENPLAKVRGLAGVQFDWKLTGRPSLGVVAEDVARVLPEVVSREPQTGVLQGVSYDSLVGVLLESSKAQGRQIDALRAKRDQLRRLLEALMKSNRKLEERIKP